jgi:hypothetical protein
VIAAIATRSPWWLLLAPASQLTGLIGHLCFERSYVDVRDVVFSWRACVSLNRMFLNVVSGRYWSEVRRVQRRYAEFAELA